MKKILLILAAAALSLSPLRAQTDEEFRAQYLRQASAVGLSGMGVDYILGKWEKAFPESPAMLRARFSYMFDKCRMSQMVIKDQSRFLGEAPVVTLKDSLGRDVNYFEEFIYDDALFGAALKYLDRGIEARPDDISFRFDKISALLAYEKESPEMAGGEILALIDLEASSHPAWRDGDAELEREDFASGIQDYCSILYGIASPVSYEMFRGISERMAKLYPGRAEFMCNLGSYWFGAQKNYNKALNCYGKALKIDPDNYAAIKNCVLAARKGGNVKMEKKYLPMLIRVTPSEAERRAAEARLGVL